MPLQPPSWATIADLSDHAALAYDSEVDVINWLAQHPSAGHLVPGSYKTYLSTTFLPVLGDVLVFATMFATISNDQLTISFKGTSGLTDIGSLAIDARFAAEIQVYGYSPTLLTFAGQFVDL